MSEKEELFEETLSSEKIYDGVLLHVRRDEIRLPNGNTTVREWLHQGQAVCVVPVTDDGNVIMERQFRYPLGRVITEIPAGKLESGEDPLEGIKRELEEETGIIADKWISLGEYEPAAAYTSEHIYMYMATGLHQKERHLDDDEFLNVFEAPLKDLVQDIMDGKISDGKTVSAILKAARIYGV